MARCCHLEIPKLLNATCVMGSLVGNEEEISDSKKSTGDHMSKAPVQTSSKALVGWRGRSGGAVLIVLSRPVRKALVTVFIKYLQLLPTLNLHSTCSRPTQSQLPPPSLPQLKFPPFLQSLLSLCPHLHH